MSKASNGDMPSTFFLFLGCVSLFSVVYVGHCLGVSQGTRQGKWDADHECRKKRDKEQEKRLKDMRTTGGKDLRALKEKVVFDFETCTVGTVTKAISIADVTVIKALTLIKRYEVSVCGSGRYWYNCGEFSCNIVRRRNRAGERIDSYGNRIPER